MRMESPADNHKTSLDKQALVEIYDKYSPALYRYAYRLLGDASLAEDCVSETFSRYLQALRGGGGPKVFLQAYLYRVAHNWITDHYRRQPDAQETLDLDIAGETQADPQANLFAQVAERSTHEKVRQALMRLPGDQRQVVVLRFLEERSHDDVANAMGKTIEATRALQYRALTTLRTWLVEEEVL